MATRSVGAVWSDGTEAGPLSSLMKTRRRVAIAFPTHRVERAWPDAKASCKQRLNRLTTAASNELGKWAANGLDRWIFDSAASPRGKRIFSDLRLRISCLVVALRRSLNDPGTDHGDGVGFDQQDGSAVGDWTGCDLFGAYASVARHAVKCAEWRRTQDVACRSLAWTGWPGVRGL